MKKIVMLVLFSFFLSGCAYTRAYSVIKQSFDDSDELKRKMSRFDYAKNNRLHFIPNKMEIIEVKENFRVGYLGSAIKFIEDVGSNKETIKVVSDQKINVVIVYDNIYGVKTFLGNYYCGKYSLGVGKNIEFKPFIVDLAFESNGANTSKVIYDKYCSK